MKIPHCSVKVNFSLRYLIVSIVLHQKRIHNLMRNGDRKTLLKFCTRSMLLGMLFVKLLTSNACSIKNYRISPHIHKEEKLYLCVVCGTEFITILYYKSLTCTRKRSFTCALCVVKCFNHTVLQDLTRKRNFTCVLSVVQCL